MAAGVPGIAAADPPDAPQRAANRAVLLHGLDEVGAARRIEAALATEEGTQQELVHPNHGNQHRGRKPHQPTRGQNGIASYYTEDIPEQHPGWREMIFSRRRPELYGILPTVNEVIMKYRPVEVPEE